MGQKIELFASVWVIGIILCSAFTGLLLEQSFAGFLVGGGCGLIFCLPSFVIKLFQVNRSIKRM